MRTSREPLSVCLIQAPSSCVDDDRLEPNLGLLYVAAQAERTGASVRIHDLSGSRNELAQDAASVPEADVYGLSVLCTTHATAAAICRSLRVRYPDAYLVAGGPNPTALPQRTLDDLAVDAVVVGEGEIAFAQLLDRLRRGVRQRGIVLGQGLSNIDDYELPARHMVDLSTYSRQLAGEPAVSLVSSRGCRYACAHCNSIVMRQGGLPPRYRSIPSIVAELRGLRTRYRCFRFNDDHFTGHPHLHQLLEGLWELDLRFRIFARLEDLTPGNCAALRRAGCVHVAVGLESLDPENLRVLGKLAQLDHIDNLRAAQNAGLTVRAYFMVGLPHDSDERIDQTADRALALHGIDEFCVYPILPYPGTPIALDPARFGYRIVDEDFTSYVQIGRQRRAGYALAHANFGPRDVQRWRDRLVARLSAGGLIFASDSLSHRRGSQPEPRGRIE